MRLRPYQRVDLSAIADIAAICNLEDALSNYLSCNGTKYWTSYRLSNLRWLRDKIAEPGSVAWVVITEEGDRPLKAAETVKPGKIIGWTIWVRNGKSEAARSWQRPNETLGMKIERGLYNLQAKYYDYMPNVNPTWDKEHNKNIQPILGAEWDHEIFPEAWELRGCYIDPAWQRRGVGSLLVKWGLEQAQREGVPAVVKSSPVGLGMYEKNGFRRVEKMGFDKWFQFPGEGCWALVWEPVGAEERWWERAVEAARRKQVQKERAPETIDRPIMMAIDALQRHLKCDYDNPVCERCERNGDACVRGATKIKFRHGSSARYDSGFSKDQTWLKPPGTARHLEYIDETEDLIAFYAQGGTDSDTASNGDAQDGVLAAAQARDLRLRASSFKSDFGVVEDDQSTPPLSSRSMRPPSPRLDIPRSTDIFNSPTKRRRTNDSEPLPTLHNAAFNQNGETADSLPSISPAMSFLNLQTPTYPPQQRPRSADNALGAPSPFDYAALLNLHSLSPTGFFADLTTNQISSVHSFRVNTANLENLPSNPSYTGPYSPALHLHPAESPISNSSSWTWSQPTLREAILMRYFIENLAHWFDLCDPELHFALVVPQRARHCPPLLNAIFTASARHLTRIRRYKINGSITWGGHVLHDLKSETAIYYHNESINHLIQLSMEPDQVHNADLLAAAIILRFYEEVDAPLRVGAAEEIDSDDEQVESELFLKVINLFINAQAPAVPRLPHTSPLNSQSGVNFDSPDNSTNIIANNQTSPTSISSPPVMQHNPSISNSNPEDPTPRIPRADGLRQACFWVALRQEIYSAFMKQRAPNLPLSRCGAFRSFTTAEDAVWADRLIVFCADVLQFCYGTEYKTQGPQAEKERWDELRATEKKWAERLPSSFEPIYFREPSKTRGEVFPEIWYLADCHVAGVQHVELARILLGVYNPAIPRLGPGHVASMNKLSVELKAIVLRLCGIALSNRKAPPGLVTACMGIAMCGERFNERIEQVALLGVLDEMEREHAWPTEATVKVLKAAWGWV